MKAEDYNDKCLNKKLAAEYWLVAQQGKIHFVYYLYQDKSLIKRKKNERFSSDCDYKVYQFLGINSHCNWQNCRAARLDRF